MQSYKKQDEGMIDRVEENGELIVTAITASFDVSFNSVSIEVLQKEAASLMLHN